MAIAQHIVLRLADSRVVAPSSAARRLVARVVLEQGRGDGLLAFGLADTHQHLLVACSREAAGQLARRVEISLVRRLGLEVGFAPAHVEPVVDGRHLGRAFPYVLKQCAHHGLEWDPLHEGSNLPDLLGLRLLGAYSAANVRRPLPRVGRSDLVACLGLETLEPADGPPDQIFTAALAATALPDLSSKTGASVDARRAVVQLAGSRLRARELGSLLGVSDRAVHHLRRRRPADPRLLQAMRLQLGLIGHRAGATSPRDRPFSTE